MTHEKTNMAEEHNAHILVVDDESGFRTLLQRILEPAGYEVRMATDAHDALRSLEASPPAVAICDIHMPGPTGLWLANQIRERSPHTAMILATSDASVPPTESLRKGIVAYILKPFQRQAVLTAVAEAYRWWATESGRELPALIPVEVPAPSLDPTSEPAVRRPQPDSRWAGLHVSVPVAIAALMILGLIIAAIVYR